MDDGRDLLRRGYNGSDGSDGSDGLGRLDAGLFFIGYQRDPRKQFVPIQTQFARHDRMNEYVRHVSSGPFAYPPGVRDKGDFWGNALFMTSRGPCRLFPTRYKLIFQRTGHLGLTLTLSVTMITLLACGDALAG